MPSDDQIERLAGKVHDAYLATVGRLGLGFSQETQVPYSELSERYKELDRATVRAVLEALETEETTNAK